MSAGDGADGSGASADWLYEHRYQVIVANQTVREAIGRNAARAHTAMSAQEFISLAAAVIPLVGRRLPGAAAQGRRLGLALRLRSGKTREARPAMPVGRAIAAVLCSLALRGQGVRGVEQYEDGCTVTADIPSDARTFGGVLTVTVTRGPDGATTLLAKAEIPGQLIDWGKGRGVLEALFGDVEGAALI